MKRLLLTLILTLSFQSWTIADDIRDFQIEGMSIGDSALKHYSIKQIKLVNKYDCKNSNFKDCGMFQALMGKKGIYNGNIILTFKKNDSNFIIHGIAGSSIYTNNIKDCYLKQNEIESELDGLFPNIIKKRIEKAHSGDPTGKSRNKSFYFNFPGNSRVYVSCYDWSKEMKYKDHLRVGIQSSILKIWLDNKAYK